MAEYIQFSEEFYKEVVAAAQRNNCTIEVQVDNWARLGLIIEQQASEIEINAVLSGYGKVRLVPAEA